MIPNRPNRTETSPLPHRTPLTLILTLVLTLVLAALPLGHTAIAQPTMDSLWPNTDGLRWDYAIDMIELDVEASGTGYLVFDGMRSSAGGPVQNLIGESSVGYPYPRASLSGIPLPPRLRPWMRTLWIARPDLRGTLDRLADSMGKQYGWPASFIHDGGFDKQASLIQMWEDLEGPTWRYLEDDISVGATFTVALLPGIATDVFLHAEIVALDAVVDTPAGSFSNGVRVDYVVDLGEADLTDEGGNVVGTITGEFTGHVVYVPDVGPVLVREDHVPILTADCGAEVCPPDLADLVGVVTLEIDVALLRTPVPSVQQSWGSLKADYGQ